VPRQLRAGCIRGCMMQATLRLPIMQPPSLLTCGRCGRPSANAAHKEPFSVESKNVLTAQAHLSAGAAGTLRCLQRTGPESSAPLPLSVLPSPAPATCCSAEPAMHAC